MHRLIAYLKEDVALLQPRVGRRCALSDLGHLRGRAFDRIFGFLHIDPDPAVTRVAEANVIAANLFRGIDRQCVASGTAVHAADKNAHDLSLKIEQWSACFTALGWEIDPQVCSGKIAAEKLAIKTSDHSETG